MNFRGGVRKLVFIIAALLAMSPAADTCSAPRMLRLSAPPRIMANESALEK